MKRVIWSTHEWSKHIIHLKLSYPKSSLGLPSKTFHFGSLSSKCFSPMLVYLRDCSICQLVGLLLLCIKSTPTYWVRTGKMHIISKQFRYGRTPALNLHLFITFLLVKCILYQSNLGIVECQLNPVTSNLYISQHSTHIVNIK